MALSCPFGFSRCVPQENGAPPPYYKSLSNQACSVKMAGYWPHSLSAVFMDLDSVSFHNEARKKNYVNAFMRFIRKSTIITCPRVAKLI